MITYLTYGPTLCITLMAYLMIFFMTLLVKQWSKFWTRLVCEQLFTLENLVFHFIYLPEDNFIFMTLWATQWSQKLSNELTSLLLLYYKTMNSLALCWRFSMYSQVLKALANFWRLLARHGMVIEDSDVFGTALVLSWAYIFAPLFKNVNLMLLVMKLF